MPAIGEAPPNLLRNLMDQVEDLDLDAMAGDELGAGQVSNLLVPGLEMSKIFAVIEFGFRTSGHETGILDGIDMMSRKDAIKQIASTYVFEIKPSKGNDLARYYVDMRKKGTIVRLKSDEKPPSRPDLTLRLADRDMVALALGSQTPQRAFLSGKVKAKGNIILGLRLTSVLSRELGKLTRQSKL